MSDKLTWRIEGRPAPTEARSAPPSGQAPRPRPRLLSRPAYGLVLLAAMALGFAFGRWTEVEAEPWLGVRDTLEFSRWALLRGDEDLAARALDPLGPALWLQGELARQAALDRVPGPEDLLELDRLEADLVRAHLATTEDGRRAETRYYRRRGARWLQVPPPGPEAGPTVASGSQP